MSKLARTVAAVLVAGAPLLAFSSPASAATGCGVNNTGNSSTNHVQIVIDPTSGNPITIAASSSSVSCEYVTETGNVQLDCTLVGGRCVAYIDGVQRASCVASNNTSCTTTFTAPVGSTIRLEVVGGRGTVTDIPA